MLNSVDYKAYVSRTIAFARTIVIKSEDIAKRDNAIMLSMLNIPIPDNKAEWRYYMNLNGEYHSTDEMMVVISLDNGSTINFTKANLDNNPATKRAYREGSYHYTRLSDKYPGQRDLINGIINPIPPSESIPAKNYQILRYNQDYVLWNEYQLIPALQEHIYTMTSTAFKTEYILTDNLMLTLLIGNLHGSLTSAILQIREEAKGTRYAHDFHIWSRLQSFGLSTIYKQVLNRNQTMWLYRNLGYVLRLQGRRKTFNELVEVILTQRKIPLARYEVLQTTENQLTSLVPEAKFISKPVNLVEEFGMSTRLWTVPELIRKERSLALDNERLTSISEDTAEYRIKYGMTSQIPTKVLESTMVDATDRNPQSIMRVLHNHWVYLASNDIYNINHDFTDLRTGRNFRLGTKDAYILWCYLVDRYNGFPRDLIPYYDYYKVRKIVPPTYQTLMGLGNRDILTEELTKDILKVDVQFSRIISPDGFFLKCKEVFDKMWDHKKLYARVMNMVIKTQTENACNALYETGVVQLTNDVTYQEFLSKRDLSFEDYGSEELLDLAWGIWKKVTGWENVNYITVADQQRGLINLMADLSSYTVQYVGSTGNTEGNYELGGDMLLDSDVWTDDDGSGIENDSFEQILPDINRLGMEAGLEIETRALNIEGTIISEVSMHLEVEMDLLFGNELWEVELPPEPSAYFIPGGMHLTMERYD